MTAIYGSPSNLARMTQSSTSVDFGLQYFGAPCPDPLTGNLDYQDVVYPAYNAIPSHAMNPPHYFQRSSYANEALNNPGNENSIRPSPPASPSTFSHSYGHPPSTMSSASGPSAQSTGSSAGGSPPASMNSQMPQPAKWSDPLSGLNIGPGIVNTDLALQDPYAADEFHQTMALDEAKYQGFVDPSLLQHLDIPLTGTAGLDRQPVAAQEPSYYPSNRMQSTSPTASNGSNHERNRQRSKMRSNTNSPYAHTNAFQPYPQTQEARRFSIASSNSRNSMESPISSGVDDEGRERKYCGDCGRPFKDLKAHMLTHQSERPEKCPIATCSYHTKGFARKYDKNRHTLTHYKGTMVCGFCPGSGSASEKSFNRADVFKRHLTACHGVEQTAPNSRKKSQGALESSRLTLANDATGKCSTCAATFSNAQDFYEHLDDCVLRVVQQEEPSEAINENILRAVNEDENVQDSLERHMLPTSIDMKASDGDSSGYEETELDQDDAKEDSVDPDLAPDWHKSGRSGKGSIVPRKDTPS